jgi:hypothetical protein
MMQRLTETILPFLPLFHLFQIFLLQYGVVLSVSAVTDTHKPGYRRTVVLLSSSLRFFVSLMILPYIHPQFTFHPQPYPAISCPS